MFFLGPQKVSFFFLQRRRHCFGDLLDMPRKRRKCGKPKRYEPHEVIRNRSTASKKRARRRKTKFCSQSKLHRKLQRTQDDSDEDLPFLTSDENTDTSDDEEPEQQPWRPVQNVSKVQSELMQKAVQVKTDFPDDIKVEYPRYRCNCCHKYFNLEVYRKVCCNNCHKYFKLQANNTCVSEGQFVCNNYHNGSSCKLTIPVSVHVQDNFKTHLAKDKRQQKGSLQKWFAKQKQKWYSGNAISKTADRYSNTKY